MLLFDLAINTFLPCSRTVGFCRAEFDKMSNVSQVLLLSCIEGKILDDSKSKLNR